MLWVIASFNFWVDRIESFYCNLHDCSWQNKGSFGGFGLFLKILDAADASVSDTNRTNYRCEHIECACVPGRFLCGEEGSVSE